MKTSTKVVAVIVVIISISSYILSNDVLTQVLITIGGITLVIGLHLQSKPKDEKKYNDLEKFDLTEKYTKECPVCNTDNNINRTYCRQCNTFIKNIVCPVCEHKNPFDQKYCQNCDSILQNKVRY